jgi:hypothetical protein
MLYPAGSSRSRWRLSCLDGSEAVGSVVTKPGLVGGGQGSFVITLLTAIGETSTLEMES